MQGCQDGIGLLIGRESPVVLLLEDCISAQYLMSDAYSSWREIGTPRQHSMMRCSRDCGCCGNLRANLQSSIQGTQSITCTCTRTRPASSCNVLQGHRLTPASRSAWHSALPQIRFMWAVTRRGGKLCTCGRHSIGR